MAEINISFTAPVQVIVDLDSGKVQRVVVIDEGVQADREGFVEVYGDVRRQPTPAEVTAAFKIAEDPETEWPVWDMGW